jgi:uncharacterized protein
MNNKPLTASILLTLIGLPLLNSAFGVEAPAKENEKTPADLEAAANAGDPEAQFLLGKAYWHGNGVKMDRRKAVEYYRKAAEKNHANALAGLGVAYALGSGVDKKNETVSLDYTRKAAEQGSPIGQMNFGVALLDGRGVEKNKAEGLRLITKAAEAGLDKAQFCLAQLYVLGDSETPSDYEQAIKWASKAADQDEPAALNLYGVMLRDGMGIKRDPEAAVPYFRRAAEKNLLKAYVNLGLAYFNGVGVERDPITGLSWWYAGEALGDGLCRETAIRFATDMPSGDIDKAKELGRKMARERSSAVIRSRLLNSGF